MFVQANQDHLILEAEDNGPVKLDLTRSYALPPAATALGPSSISRNLVRYLNATTGRGPYDQIHQQMVSSKGKVLVELVETLSGKNVPGKVCCDITSLIYVYNNVRKFTDHSATVFRCPATAQLH